MAQVIQVSSMIEKLMRQNNLTMKELADKIGISESSVSLWISGKTTPRMGMIQKLADFFGVETDEMIFGKYYDEELKRREGLKDYIALAIEADNLFGVGANNLLMSFRKLNDEGRAKLLEDANDLTLIYKYIKQDSN